MKRILDIGNCGPDHAAITRFFQDHYECEVAQADRADDGLAKMKALAESGAAFDLVVVNRKLDVDYSDGIDVIKRLKEDPETKGTPVMLITNYPEHQDAAESIGAVRGFGKLEYNEPATIERVRAILG